MMIYANVYAEGRNNNSIFEIDDSVHKYNPSHTPRLMRKLFLNQGIEINTPDINQGRPVSFDIHLEGSQLPQRQRPQYLIAMENPNINKLNCSIEYSSSFNLVFTWNKRLHHLPNIVPVMIPHPMHYGEFTTSSSRKIFSCLINANKYFKEEYPNDLYRERLKVIRWYEKYAPHHFELYGLGWDKPPPAYTLAKRIRRGMQRLRSKIDGKHPFPSYRGEIREKSEILQQSRFSYCFENNSEIPNYITEKIFDSLVNGCIPIYWGASNIEDYIPIQCFIDRRNFKNTAEVHAHLLTINNDSYSIYQDNIRNFLASSDAVRFSSNHVLSTIIEHICIDFKKQLNIIAPTT